MTSKPFLAVLAASLALAAPGAVFAAPAASTCKMTQIGEIPIVMRGQKPLVETTINGHKVMLMIDSGAFFSTLYSADAKAAGLTSLTEDRVRMVGLGGDHQVGRATLKDFQIGNLQASGAQVFVTAGASEGDGEAGVLGQNVFAKSDIEFDFAHGMVRLFQPEGCEKSVLAYWADAAAGAELDADSLAKGEFVVPVQINGKKLLAQIDSGASVSVLTLSVAKSAGVNPNAPEVTPVDPLYGFGRKGLQGWSARFDSFSIGQETVQKVRMLVADLGRNTPLETATGSIIGTKILTQPDMLLGADFLMAHRVYVARSQKRIYFTYNSGPIFRLIQDKPKP